MIKFFTIIFISLGSWALAYGSEISYLVKGSIQSGQIALTVYETQPSAQACYLLFEKMEYFADLQILDLRLREVKNCPIDVYGNRKSEIIWFLPSYFAPKDRIQVRVNGAVLGEINFGINTIGQINEGGRP